MRIGQDSSALGARRAGVEMVMPGDIAGVMVELDKAIALEAQPHFPIREGSCTVGHGIVTQTAQRVAA